MKQLRKKIQQYLRKRYTKRQLHNMRAIFLRIVCLAVLVLIVLGGVMGIRKVKKNIAAKQEAELAAMEALSVEEEEPQTFIDIVMVGDTLLHENVETRSLQEDGTYDYSDIFSKMKGDISGADLALVNEEIIIGGDELGVYGYPSFNAPSDLTDGIADAGFDVVLLATNHCTDMMANGITNCLNVWEERHPEVEVLGIHDTTEDAADNIYIWEKEGVKIAILNYTTILNGDLGYGNEYMVDCMMDADESKVRSDIQKAHEMADFVIVCPHWGTEDSQEISPEQEKWTDIFLEEGVDLVLGAHTHCAGQVKMVSDPDSGHDMLVYYSTGNFVSWIDEGGEKAIGHLIGGMPKIRIGLMQDGTYGVVDYRIKAMVAHYTGKDDDIVVYPVSQYSEELAEQHFIHEFEPTDFSYAYIKDYLDQVWGDLWE